MASQNIWSSDFLQNHPSLPLGLLQDNKQPLPFETHGLGNFARYGVAQVMCDPPLVPSRKTAGAAGHDLYSIEENTIPASGSAVFDTGVSIALPTQHYGKIEGRSSLGFAHGIVAFGGIIDEDYRGPIKVKLFNHGSSDYSVQKNDRIAQLVIQKYVAPPFRIVTEFETVSARGSAGFGSTGK